MPHNETPCSKHSERIIGAFINELYAILVSIGMGSVVLRDNFDFFDSFRLVSAVFVVGVAISYWWDWVRNIENHADTKIVELVIDLLIVGVFLLMFAYYDQPQWLAKLLVALSILDLSWVINCYYEDKSKEVRSGIEFRRWIWRKIFAVAIFLITYAVTPCLYWLLSPCLSLRIVWLTMVVVTFVPVRILLFRR